MMTPLQILMKTLDPVYHNLMIVDSDAILYDNFNEEVVKFTSQLQSYPFIAIVCGTPIEIWNEKQLVGIL